MLLWWTYGDVVERVNVSVVEYVPVLSASLAPMCWVNPMLTGSWLTGAFQLDFESETCSGLGSVNAPGPTACASVIVVFGSLSDTKLSQD